MAVAKHDATVVDHRGLPVRIVVGTEVPAHLQGAYEKAVGGRGKAQRAPERDKAHRAPDRDK